MAQTSVDDDLVVDEYVALSCPHNPVVLVDDVIGRELLLSTDALIQLQKADENLKDLYDVIVDFEGQGQKILIVCMMVFW